MKQKDIIELTTLAAARQELSRDQIAEWDASARAWLRTADAVKTRQQKQLMLIIDNVRGSVNKMTDTYESVMAAWKNSLTQMEGLIEGISQQATNGDILLALTAWHLFPDMIVVVPCTTHVRQYDPIFASGGVLTIGLEKPGSYRSGVYWSLPLARLRHYGAPVVSERSIDSSERSRISLNEFLQATLGCFLQGWGEAGANTLIALEWLSRLSDLLVGAASTGSVQATAMIGGRAEFSWLNILFAAAKSYLNSAGNERVLAKKLISLGRKHGKAFFGLPAAPVFGLLHRGSFISLMKTEDDQIHFLRKVAKDIQRELRLESHQIFIRYRHHYADWSKDVYEYATAVPWSTVAPKRKFDQIEHGSGVHRRWLYAGGNLKRVSDGRYYERMDAKYDASTYNSYRLVPHDFVGWHITRGHTGSMFASSDRDLFTAAEGHSIREEFEARGEAYSAAGEGILKREEQYIEDFAVDVMGLFWDQMGKVHSGPSKAPWYRLLYGEINSAAIFVLEGEEKMIDLIRPVGKDSQEMYALFESNKVEPTAVVSHLSRAFQTANPEVDPHLKSLKAVSTAAMVYKNFPNATVDVRILQRCLYDASWIRTAVARRPMQQELTSRYGTPSCLEPYILDREAAFACILMFESGQYEANPSDLTNVMAMSSGDSIYVGAALLCDPSEESYSGSVKRIVGNIGRPGIAFLVPPLDPLIKEVSISEWPQICRDDFAGQIRNSFEGTSLHLSFTGASTPFNIGFSGAQDADVYMLETLISVHDNGRWIADLNVLKTFQSPQLFLIPSCEDLNQKHGPKAPTSHMTCIDNWLELADEPEPGLWIVQAHKNWEARLAAASISIAKGYDTFVTPENVCWQCFDDTIYARSAMFRPVIAIG